MHFINWILRIKRKGINHFRLLPELHKKQFLFRPIKNCKNNPTSKIANFINIVLQPLVSNTDSYIKDSQDLINKTSNIHFNSSIYLYSIDFEALYMNIDTNRCLNYICEYVKPFLSDSKHINIVGFYK